jgi:hypothetical protein
VELPPKIPYYASLFVVANARKGVVGKDVLDWAVGKTKELLLGGKVLEGKLMLRFLAGLNRIIEGDGLMGIMGEIVSQIEGKEANVHASSGARTDLGPYGWVGQFGVIDVTLHCRVPSETYRGVRRHRGPLDFVHGLPSP